MCEVLRWEMTSSRSNVERNQCMLLAEKRFGFYRRWRFSLSIKAWICATTQFDFQFRGQYGRPSLNCNVTRMSANSMISLLEREHVVLKFTDKEAASIRILFLLRESHQLIVQRPLNKKKVIEDIGTS